MSNDLPRLTGGAQGPVQFHHMNRVLDATAAVERELGGQAGPAPTILRGFWVKLLAQSGTVGSYNLWTWARVAVNAGATDVVSDSSLITSALYSSGGKAIDIAGTAAVDAIAFIYELVGMNNVRYFAIASSSGGGGGGTALRIDSGAGDPLVAAIEYAVTEGTVDETGAFTAGSDSGVMWNLYEGPGAYGHGQSTTFGTGTLTPTPLSGIVFGGLSSIVGAVRVYVCDIPNPMEPECAVPADDAAENTLMEVMRYGL